MDEHNTDLSPKSKSTLAVRISGRVAAVVLIGLVLVYLKAILIPLVFAFLLAFLLKPFVDVMVRRKVPSPVAILVAEGVATLPVVVLGFVFLSSAGALTEQLPKYQNQLVTQADHTLNSILVRVGEKTQRARIRTEVVKNLLPSALNEGATFVRNSITAVTSAVGTLFLTLVLSAFILFEVRRFREKFHEAYGEAHPLIDDIEGIGDDVRAYVIAKTLISALTGLAVWAFLALMGVDFAAFWGLLAFPLNFIPTVGALVASIPPILLAMIDPNFTVFGVACVFTGLIVINGFIGAVLDPRYVGNAVHLSPLIVFISMLGWGVLWGPIGMILSVPIMVSFKVICSRIPAMEPVATLMKG
jgi:AI-2 transport protein TqsA